MNTKDTTKAVARPYAKQLDGLRCFACLLVVASHCNLMGLSGHGGVPVAFFFALSGFLLVIPWKQNGEENYFSIKYIAKDYYLKKAVRLLPPYYIIIFLHAYLSNNLDYLRGNVFFTASTGHFWYIQQYFFIITIAPVFMILIAFSKSKLHVNNYIIAVVLLIGAYLFKKYVTTKVFYLIGNGKKQELRLSLFLAGMAFGYLYKGLKRKVIQNQAIKIALDLLGTVILAAGLFSAAHFLGMVNPALAEYKVGWSKAFECAVVSGILIFCVMVNSEGLLSKTLSFPLFTFIGKMSYVVYLVHMVLMEYVPGTTASRYFVRVLILSLGIAYLMDDLIMRRLRH